MYPVTTNLTRRTLLGLCAVAALFPASVLRAAPAKLPELKLTHSPGCSCCIKWAEKMREAGFTVTVTGSLDMQGVKANLNVPAKLASCHTAQIGDYVIEGHVPASAIKRLLVEKPKATGLAVPGMPVGAPGMESGAPVDYDVILFGPKDVEKVFGRYNGEKRL